MSNIWAVAYKELRSYFVSPIAYVVLTMVTFVTSRGVRQNQYARELVACNVTVDELFA